MNERQNKEGTTFKEARSIFGGSKDFSELDLMNSILHLNNTLIFLSLLVVVYV